MSIELEDFHEKGHKRESLARSRKFNGHIGTSMAVHENPSKALGLQCHYFLKFEHKLKRCSFSLMKFLYWNCRGIPILILGWF